MAELTGRRRFAHLYRRAGFGATPTEISQAMTRHADQDTAFGLAVDALLNYASVPEAPDGVVVDPASRDSQAKWWLDRMLRTTRPLLEKITLFWHDHFATSVDKDGMDVPKMQRQNELFRTMGMGPFEPFLNAVSRDPAMMVWLDLTSNRKNSPNENYAREVMELFTLGVGTPSQPTYSENDIKQATRAFTGYTIGTDGNWLLNANQHDAGTKTVLGQSCESGDQVHHVLLSHIQNGRNVSAHYLTAKLFSFLAYPVDVDSSIVLSLAPGFAASGHNVRWLVEQILKSPQFSSNAAYRAIIKSPVEVAIQILRTLGAARIQSNGVQTRLVEQGMRLFQPPDVSGWPSGRSWINATTILSRSNMAAAIVNSLGKTEATEAGGQTVVSRLRTATNTEMTATEKVNYILDLFGLYVDADGNDISPATRNALIAYANTATTDPTKKGLFNLVLALPSFQLN